MPNKVLPIQLGEAIKIPAKNLSPLLERKIHERLVFTNPEYERRHNAGLWIGNIPPTISCIRKSKNSYVLPRGFIYELINLCHRYKQPYKIIDQRRSFPPVDFEFYGYLKEYQQKAAEAILERDTATLVGGYKSGKTVISIYTISERKQPTLIIIPKLELLDGWLKKLKIFLQIPPEEVGLFIRDKKTIGKRVTIAHISEVNKNLEELRDSTGYVVIDDANRCSLKMIMQVLSNFDSMYMLALCSELNPQDKQFQVITLYIGEVAYTIDIQNAREGCGSIKAEVIAKTTDFSYSYHSRMDYLPMLCSLMEDEARTEMILQDVRNEIQKGEIPVGIVTGGPLQEDIFYQSLLKEGFKVIKIPTPYETLLNEEDSDLYGEDESLELNLEDYEAIVLTTRGLIAHYKKIRHIKSLFFAVPLYFNNQLISAIQGIAEPNGYKEEDEEDSGNARNGKRKLRIYDYVDSNISILENYFRMRSYNYGVSPEVLLKKK